MSDVNYNSPIIQHILMGGQTPPNGSGISIDPALQERIRQDMIREMMQEQAQLNATQQPIMGFMPQQPNPTVIDGCVMIQQPPMGYMPQQPMYPMGMDGYGMMQQPMMNGYGMPQQPMYPMGMMQQPPMGFMPQQPMMNGYGMPQQPMYPMGMMQPAYPGQMQLTEAQKDELAKRESDNLLEFMKNAEIGAENIMKNEELKDARFFQQPNNYGNANNQQIPMGMNNYQQQQQQQYYNNMYNQQLLKNYDRQTQDIIRDRIARNAYEDNLPYAPQSVPDPDFRIPDSVIQQAKMQPYPQIIYPPVGTALQPYQLAEQQIQQEKYQRQMQQQGYYPQQPMNGYGMPQQPQQQVAPQPMQQQGQNMQQQVNPIPNQKATIVIRPDEETKRLMNRGMSNARPQEEEEKVDTKETSNYLISNPEKLYDTCKELDDQYKDRKIIHAFSAESIKEEMENYDPSESDQPPILHISAPPSMERSYQEKVENNIQQAQQMQQTHQVTPQPMQQQQGQNMQQQVNPQPTQQQGQNMQMQNSMMQPQGIPQPMNNTMMQQPPMGYMPQQPMMGGYGMPQQPMYPMGMDGYGMMQQSPVNLFDNNVPIQMTYNPITGAQPMVKYNPEVGWHYVPNVESYGIHATFGGTDSTTSPMPNNAPPVPEYVYNNLAMAPFQDQMAMQQPPMMNPTQFIYTQPQGYYPPQQMQMTPPPTMQKPQFIHPGMQMNSGNNMQQAQQMQQQQINPQPTQQQQGQNMQQNTILTPQINLSGDGVPVADTLPLSKKNENASFQPPPPKVLKVSDDDSIPVVIIPQVMQAPNPALSMPIYKYPDPPRLPDVNILSLGAIPNMSYLDGNGRFSRMYQAQNEYIRKEQQNQIDQLKALSRCAHTGLGEPISEEKLSELYDIKPPRELTAEEKQRIEDERRYAECYNSVYGRDPYAELRRQEYVYSKYAEIHAYYQAMLGNCRDLNTFLNRAGTVLEIDRRQDEIKRPRRLDQLYDQQAFKEGLKIPSGIELMDGVFHVSYPGLMSEKQLEQRKKLFWDIVESNTNRTEVDPIPEELALGGLLRNAKKSKSNETVATTGDTSEGDNNPNESQTNVADVQEET